MLEWVGYVKPNPSQLKDPEVMFLTNSIGHKMVRGNQKGLVIVLFLVPDLRSRDAAVQLGELNAICSIGP